MHLGLASGLVALGCKARLGELLQRPEVSRRLPQDRSEPALRGPQLPLAFENAALQERLLVLVEAAALEEREERLRLRRLAGL